VQNQANKLKDEPELRITGHNTESWECVACVRLRCSRRNRSPLTNSNAGVSVVVSKNFRCVVAPCLRQRPTAGEMQNETRLPEQMQVETNHQQSRVLKGNQRRRRSWWRRKSGLVAEAGRWATRHRSLSCSNLCATHKIASKQCLFGLGICSPCHLPHPPAVLRVRPRCGRCVVVWQVLVLVRALLPVACIPQRVSSSTCFCKCQYVLRDCVPSQICPMMSCRKHIHCAPPLPRSARVFGFLREGFGAPRDCLQRR